VLGKRALQPAQIIADQFVDQFDHAVPALGGRHEGGDAFDGGGRVGHRHGAFAAFQKGMIVFRVADPCHLVTRKSQFPQRVSESRALVDAGRKHHHRAAITDHLGLEAEFPDDVLDGCTMWRVGRHQHLSDLERCDAARQQGLHQQFGRWIGESRFLPARGIVNDCTVLGDDEVEQLRAGTDRKQIVELAARDQNRPPAGYPQAFQRVYHRLRQPVIRRQGAIVVRHQCEVTHIVHPLSWLRALRVGSPRISDGRGERQDPPRMLFF